jgi:hypothetical protein
VRWQVRSVLALLLIGLLAGCRAETAGLVAVLDEVGVPGDWKPARTVVHAPGGDVECQPSPVTDCPFVERYLVAGAEPRDAYAAGSAAVRAAGFRIEREFDPDCERQGSPPCGFTAERGDREVQVNVYEAGEDDGAGVAEPGRVTVRITVR